MRHIDRVICIERDTLVEHVAVMTPDDVVPLHLADVTYPAQHPLAGQTGVVLGFAIRHSSGILLVDTGLGEGNDWIDESYRPVRRSARDALVAAGLDPGEVRAIVNTHLHFDHCGQNAVFRHAPFVLQRVELERARREDPGQRDWFDFAGARYELLDGDTEIAPGVRAVASPGHTTGHQSVVLEQRGERDLFIGDAAYFSAVFRDPYGHPLPPGQADDLPSWRRSIYQLQDLDCARIHYCHESGE